VFVLKGRTYNLEKLSSSGKFDIEVSARFYYNMQEYFDALTDFAKNYHHDLSNYTPAFVVNSDDDREQFMKECFEVRADFVRLGMTALLESLVVMEDAAISRNQKAFSDGQVGFHATLRICKDEIEAAANRWKLTR
jgi:hypothetical protein